MRVQSLSLRKSHACKAEELQCPRVRIRYCAYSRVGKRAKERRNSGVLRSGAISVHACVRIGGADSDGAKCMPVGRRYNILQRAMTRLRI